MIGSRFTLESTANPCRTPLAPMVTSGLLTIHSEPVFHFLQSRLWTVSAAI